jgi:hypothetical protein
MLVLNTYEGELKPWRETRRCWPCGAGVVAMISESADISGQLEDKNWSPGGTRRLFGAAGFSVKARQTSSAFKIVDVMCDSRFSQNIV